MFRNVLFFLLTHFSVGAVFTIVFISKEEIGALFFRLVTLVSAFLIGCALFIEPLGAFSLRELFSFSPPGLVYLLLLVCCLFLVTYNFASSNVAKPLLLLALASGLFGIIFYSISFLRADESNVLSIMLFFLNGLTSTFILGSVLASMITGHWYLVNHKLSLKPILTGSVIFLSSTILRTLVFFLGMAVVFMVGEGGLGRKLLSFSSLDSYIFYIRLIFGLLVPLVFAFMIRSSAKIHSTQSATGILYATIILVLVGETFAKFLQFSTGIPF